MLLLLISLPSTVLELPTVPPKSLTSLMSHMSLFPPHAFVSPVLTLSCLYPQLHCNTYALSGSVSGSCVRTNTCFCPFGLGSPHLTLCIPDPATFQPILFFFTDEKNSTGYHIFTPHSSVDGHLDMV